MESTGARLVDAPDVAQIAYGLQRRDGEVVAQTLTEAKYDDASQA